MVSMIFVNGCRQDECEIFALSQRVRMYPSIFTGALTWVRGFIDGDLFDGVYVCVHIIQLEMVRRAKSLWHTR